MRGLHKSREALMLKTDINKISVSMQKPRTYADLVHSKLAREVMQKLPPKVLCGLALEHLIDKGYLRYENGYYRGYSTRRSRYKQNRRQPASRYGNAKNIKDLIEISPNRETTTRKICDVLDINPDTARRCLHLLNCECVHLKDGSTVWRLPTEQNEQ